MSAILAIDPGPLTSGWALYSVSQRRVLGSQSKTITEDVLAGILTSCAGGIVAIERVQSYGIAGASLLDTSRVAGRFEQRALDRGCRVVLLYRREVLGLLDVTGKGSRDARVRERLVEMHGGNKVTAIGRKATPGPLYGVSGHAWQALGLAVATHLHLQQESP